VLLRSTDMRGHWDTAAAPLLRAYGESHDACAAAVRVLDGLFGANAALQRTCISGHATTVAALLGAYRRAGRAHEALAAGGDYALHSSIRRPNVLALLLAEYGAPGCDAVLAALAASRHQALWEACFNGSAPAVALLAAAYGPPGCAALRKALAASGGHELNHILNVVFVGLVDRIEYVRPHFAAILSALLAALAEPDCATAVRALGAWLEAKPSYVLAYDCTPRIEPAQRLARIPPDSLLARLAVATPAAWALNPGAARALLSAPVRASLALPRLLALRRLPGGVAAPVAAHLRARPWLLFSGAVAGWMAAAAAAAPPPA